MPVHQVVGDFTENFLKNKEVQNLGEIEGMLWKSNITFEKRKKKDFLDVSNEQLP